MQGYGIFGWPVAHSKSSAMHNAAFSSCSMDALYVPYAVPPEHLKDALGAMRTVGIRGVNLTIPHKEHALSVMDELSAAAEGIGAVNTVLQEEGRLVGHNTDAEGLSRALNEQGFSAKGKHIVLLGAGGVARAALFALGTEKAASVTVLARRQSQAQSLVECFQNTFPDMAVKAELLSRRSSSQCFASCDGIVQATNATLPSYPDSQTFMTTLDLAAAPKHAWAMDLVYAPKTGTVFCKEARATGLRHCDGTGMLLHQGALAFEFWTSVKAPIQVMREALCA